MSVGSYSYHPSPYAKIENSFKLFPAKLFWESPFCTKFLGIVGAAQKEEGLSPGNSQSRVKMPSSSSSTTSSTTTTTTTTPAPEKYYKKAHHRQNFFNNGKPQKLYFVKPSLRFYPTKTMTSSTTTESTPTSTTTTMSSSSTSPPPSGKILKKHYFRGNGKPNQLYFVKRAHYHNSHLF